MAQSLLDKRARSVSPRQSTDDYIVACAAELFLQRGVDGVKMVDIASLANVGVATLYRHFSNKTRLAVLAATMLWSRFNEYLLGLIEEDQYLSMNGLERLSVLLHGYCDAYMAHGDFVAFIDEFDRLVLTGQVSDDELLAYGAQIDSFYCHFEDAYVRGLEDGSILRRIDFRHFYVALAHALMGVAQKIRRGEVIPSDDFSRGCDELQSIVDMALWSLVSDASIPGRDND